MKSIDVLMPVYQDPAGLQLSLNSIAAQDHHGPVRVVIYDDGSKPDAWRQIEQVVAASRLDISLTRGEVNKGRPFARNALLGLVRGDYVCWLDAGDEWPASKLSIQYDAMQRAELGEPGRAVWLTSAYVMDWGGRSKTYQQDTVSDQLLNLLEGRHLRAYLWTMMMPSWTLPPIGPFDPELPRLQDLDYFLRFLVAGGQIVSVGDEPLAIYHKSDIGRDARTIRACSRHILKKHGYLYRRYGRRFVSRAKLKNGILAARFARNNSQPGLAAYFLLTAMLGAPLATAESFVRRLRGLKPLPNRG